MLCVREGTAPRVSSITDIGAPEHMRQKPESANIAVAGADRFTIQAPATQILARRSL